MLRDITELAAITSATSVVHDDQEAQLRLRIVLVGYGYDGCVFDALLDLLASGDAVPIGQCLAVSASLSAATCWSSLAESASSLALVSARCSRIFLRISTSNSSTVISTTVWLSMVLPLRP
jgi:phosphoglycerate-specific signal transduction histidine kinase